MGLVSHVEEKNMLALSNAKRSYKEINDYIKAGKEKWTYRIEKDGSIYGFDIKLIQQLSSIYNFNVYAIEFFFKDIMSSFNVKDNNIMNSLIKKMNNKLIKQKGYYIIKLPSSNTMLINQSNLINQSYIFAGNTICYLNDGSHLIREKHFNDELEIVLASKDERKTYYKEIVNLSENSFKNHFTQYHISYITREKAPLIYENWIIDYLVESADKKLLIAKYEDVLVGFLAYNENLNTIEIILNSVDVAYRGKGIYDRLLRECIKIANKKNKLITVSTQLDNYFAQRAWINCGFKPYYSFYLMHYNNL